MKNRKPILSLGGVVVASVLILSLLYAGGAFPTFAASAQQANPTGTATAVPLTNPNQTTTQAGTLSGFQAQLIQMYNQVSNSVVSIDTLGTSPQNNFSPQATPQVQPGQLVPLAAGSGVVWDNQGHIITNNHVIEGAQQITVNFHDGTSATAKVVGTDPQSDLAVLSVDVTSGQLTPITDGSMSQVQVGDLAFAIGNPYGLGSSISLGLVSALGRSLPVGNANRGNGQATYTIPDIIQTSAPINPGNSGGALVNINGQLIGITTANISAFGSGSGVGFAIPINLLKVEVPTLIQTGQYQHSYLGIEGTDLTAGITQQMGLQPNQKGALVISVASGSPAEQAGLKGGTQTVTINGQQLQIGGDVITAIDGNPINSMEDLISYLNLNTHPGQTVTLTILQNGQTQQVKVNLTARPSLPQTGATTTPSHRVVLGVEVAQVTPALIQQYNLPQGTQGLYVGAVEPGSPAAQAGIQTGDVITDFNGMKITSLQDLTGQLRQIQPGQTATVTILRNGQTQQMTVTFAQAQQTQPAPFITTTPAPFTVPTNTPMPPATNTPVPQPTNTPTSQPTNAPTSQPQVSNTPSAPAGTVTTQQPLLGFQAVVVNDNATDSSLSLPAGTRGIYVYSIQSGSLANQIGLQSGDVITGVNGQPIDTQQGLTQIVQNALNGQPVTLDVLRSGNTVHIPLNIGF